MHPHAPHLFQRRWAHRHGRSTPAVTKYAAADGPCGTDRADAALGRPTGGGYSRRAARTIWWPPVADTRASNRPSERATSAEMVARLAPV